MLIVKFQKMSHGDATGSGMAGYKVRMSCEVIGDRE
jgi:hypothetical protein